MEVTDAIFSRRSIRAFKPDPVSRQTVEKVLRAAIAAPSGKNGQPWKFVVVDEVHRPKMIEIMEAAVSAVKEAGGDAGSSEWTTKVMAQAPVTVFVFNPNEENRGEGHHTNIVDSQSIGAAIQNMLLGAMEYGLGTLWICDVFYAYRELCDWLGENHEMIAAVSIGVPDEAPDQRPRKPFDETVTWFTDGN